VEPHNPEAIADVARVLLPHERLRRAYGTAGRERVLKHYTWRRVADGAEQVYRLTVADHELAKEVA
jgi:glycosyltransferase involved in cell wall biosynthesis